LVQALLQLVLPAPGHLFQPVLFLARRSLQLRQAIQQRRFTAQQILQVPGRSPAQDKHQ
jgi:hypothetical protein